tara:strand:+ start:129 stop:419 length:291 start_codon:yes stop_codon:yes gene_type:complete
MTDMDIINSLADEPVRPPEFTSLETIIAEVPYMSVNNPATFYLYLHYNEQYLSEEEKTQVEKVINKLKSERDAITDKNISYLERHKGMALEKSIEE